MRKLFSAAIFIALTTTASADSIYDQCKADNVNGIETVQKRCGETYLTRVEGQMTRVWQDLYKSFKPNQPLAKRAQAALMDEQRKWLMFRDASCKAYLSGFFSREGQLYDYYSCRGSLIEARINELTDIAGKLNEINGVPNPNKAVSDSGEANVQSAPQEAPIIQEPANVKSQSRPVVTQELPPPTGPDNAAPQVAPSQPIEVAPSFPATEGSLPRPTYSQQRIIDEANNSDYQNTPSTNFQ